MEEKVVVGKPDPNAQKALANAEERIKKVELDIQVRLEAEEKAKMEGEKNLGKKKIQAGILRH